MEKTITITLPCSEIEERIPDIIAEIEEDEECTVTEWEIVDTWTQRRTVPVKKVEMRESPCDEVPPNAQIIRRYTKTVKRTTPPRRRVRRRWSIRKRKFEIKIEYEPPRVVEEKVEMCIYQVEVVRQITEEIEMCEVEIRCAERLTRITISNTCTTDAKTKEIEFRVWLYTYTPNEYSDDQLIDLWNKLYETTELVCNPRPNPNIERIEVDKDDTVPPNAEPDEVYGALIITKAGGMVYYYCYKLKRVADREEFEQVGRGVSYDYYESEAECWM